MTDVPHRGWRHVFALAAALVVVACGCLTPVGAGAQGLAGGQPKGALTLDDVVALALSSSPEVAAAERSLELARMRLAAAEAALRPTVTLRASPAQVSRPGDRPAPVPGAPLEPEGTRFMSTAGVDVHVPIGDARVTLSIDGSYLSTGSTEPDTDVEWSVSVSRPILGPGSPAPGGMAGGAIGGAGASDAEVRAATAQARNASFALEQARQRARAGGEAAFYAVLRDQRKLRAAEVNLERVRRHLAVTESRFGQGNASRLDVLDAKQRVRAAEAALDAATHAVTLSSMSFNRAVGRHLRSPVSLAPVADYVPGRIPDLDACVKEALERRKEASLVAEEVRDSEADLALARKGLLPAVSLVGGAKDDGSWNIGIQLAKTLTRDCGAEAAVKAAEDARAAAREKVEATKTATVLEVTKAYYALAEAEAALLLAMSGLERAGVALEAAQEQYRLGAATHQDVAAAIASAHDAEVELADATAACFVARSGLARAMGLDRLPDRLAGAEHE